MTQENRRTGAILVVDDESQLLRLLVRVIERAGYRVFSASDGKEALAVFEDLHREIDLAVLDVIIPPSGVEEVLDRMLELRHDLHVIMTSGDEPPDELRDRLRACGGVFLRKPFVPKTVVRAVKNALGEPRE